MATIYQKTVSDKTLILSPREYILRPFNFLAWTEMRFGMYFSAVASSGDNVANSNETVAISTPADKIIFGIKDSVTSDLPGLGSSLFLGAMTVSGLSSDLTSAAFQSQGNAHLAAGGYYGTTLVGGTTSQYVDPLSFPTATGASTYDAFYALKFVVSNIGTSSQSVAISSGYSGAVTGTDYSADALRILMNNATYGTANTIAWNDGATARTIPDAIFIRMPFYSNRIRLSAIRAIRYAP